MTNHDPYLGFQVSARGEGALSTASRLHAGAHLSTNENYFASRSKQVTAGNPADTETLKATAKADGLWNLFRRRANTARISRS